jgi:hypothetical protein
MKILIHTSNRLTVAIVAETTGSTTQILPQILITHPTWIILLRKKVTGEELIIEGFNDL